jgi:hypothetical protein
MTYLFSNSQLMAYWKSASLSACLITAYLLDSLDTVIDTAYYTQYTELRRMYNPVTLLSHIPY